MHQAIRCPYCDELSRVPAAALGQYVACPNCQRPFNAVAEELPEQPKRPRRNVPTVYPAKKPAPAPGWDESEDAEPTSGPKSVLFGLALLPFVVPLLWILGPVLTGKDAIFTFALPMAIALSATGLCFGVVLAADWSFATRVKGILAIVFVMHFLAALLYFMKSEWVEAFRNQLGKGQAAPSRQFSPPDKKYTVRVPREMRKDDQPLIAGWPLEVYRTVNQAGQATFFAAHGTPNVPAGQFFAEAKAKALEAAQATLTSEREINRSNNPGIELVLTLPDRNTRRVLQIYRVNDLAVVAAVEDSFLTPDADDVRSFFNHLDLTPKK